MKKIFLSMLIVLQMVLAVMPACPVSAEGNGCIASSTFEELTRTQLQYDLNGDGKVEAISTELEKNDEGENYYLIIGNRKFLIQDFPNALRKKIEKDRLIFRQVFITDINERDNHLDIVLVNTVTMLSPQLYMYDGKTLTGSTQQYFAQGIIQLGNIMSDEDERRHKEATERMKTVRDSDITVTAGDGEITFENCEGDKFVYDEPSYYGKEIEGTIIPGVPEYVYEVTPEADEETYAAEPEEMYEEEIADIPSEEYQNNGEISVLVNDEYISFDQPPVMINDRVMVPVRAIFEAMGFDVQWDEKTQCVFANGTEVSLIVMQINDPIINYVPGDWEPKKYYCDVPPQIISGRTLVPVRAIAECAGCNVRWSDSDNAVYITY